MIIWTAVINTEDGPSLILYMKVENLLYFSEQTDRNASLLF